MTALSFGGAPGVAVLGGDLSQLRRRGGRWRLRDWRLRTKLTAVLLVPLLLAGVLGALRVSDSLREAGRLDALARQAALAEQVSVVVHDLQRARHQAVSAVLDPRTADAAAVAAQQERVDRGVGALRSAGAETGDAVPAAAEPSYRTALDRLAELPALRERTSAAAAASDRGPAADQVIRRYTTMVEALLGLNRVVLANAGNPLVRHAEGAAALAQAKEQLSQQHAVLLAAMLSGALPAEQQDALRTADVRFDAAVETFAEVAPPGQQRRYQDTVTGQAIAERERLLDAALRGALQGAPLEIVPVNWGLAAADTAERIRQVETSLLNQLRTETVALGETAWNNAIRDAAVVGALLVLAVVLLVAVVRSLLQPLRILRTHAFDVADRRLPDVVEKLRGTEDKIGETTVDPVPVYSKEEVGQVARAFDTVHVQAVRLAAEQAMLRGTLNDMFLNLAGRSQRLVERQLKLIEKLESAEQDPAQLSNLFQLDHLATRMRRNSENLLVLAGGELHRRSERGVPVLDMLRAAISEVADYRRVILRRPPAVTVTGMVAGDLVHLIAELLDNATNAGPPDTPVTLSSSLGDDGGLLVEITDCGTGLPQAELHAINERLAAPPVVDVSVSRQMGLFVVSRLAARHRIRVRLRQQRGELGVTAIVQVPPALVHLDAPGSPGFPAAPAPPTPAVSAAPEVSPASPDPAPGVVRGQPRVDVPLQVSVVESPDEADPVGPSSVDTLTLRHIPKRTTEEEWHELFGGVPAPPVEDRAPAAGPRPAADTAGADAADTGDVPVAGASRADSETAAGNGSGVREEIFEAVSAWFRDRQSVPVGAPEPDGGRGEALASPSGAPGSAAPSSSLPTALDWRSAGDEGWHAADALRAQADFDLTPAGLPKRRPRAQLVPGAVGPSRPGPQGTSQRVARTPDEVRGRLSSYQQGLRHGRHARVGPEEQPAGRSPRPGPAQEGQQ